MDRRTVRARARAERVSRCSSCGAEILWVKTLKGGMMPLDAEPVSTGNIVIDEGVANVFRNAASVAPRLEHKRRYRSHFASCPNAAAHRRR